MATELTPADPTNPCGLRGIDFVEFTGPKPEEIASIMTTFGFSKLLKHRSLDVDYYRQHDIHFLLNRSSDTFAERFGQLHGPAICAMGLRVDDANAAFATAIARGAKPFEPSATVRGTIDAPAIYGIGDSLIYFVDTWQPGTGWRIASFQPHPTAELNTPMGFTCIDHLTNNVHKGTMQHWANFYKNIFGFTEVRYFDIRGVKTGLTSYALRSPDGSFCIPINEGDEGKSQIEEYLGEYNGPGIQHLAFLTEDLLQSLDQLEGGAIETLDIDDAYYETIFDRVPNVSEDPARIRGHQVLVDGDEEGYLLQIFTKNLVGPIFIELIQRKNHLSFGEGNFGALFRSIERDQQRRGVL
ncbi:MAG: 4-hydroxyphenylpyruvate dioxygenase [Myxococcales bacterium]|nr:4-hydroxyphenylpyruvate dioxygenase [Myxococcales bacterium]